MGTGEFPEIMKNAKADLAGAVSGKFSPEDWQKILARAEEEWRKKTREDQDPSNAWNDVVRDFHGSQYWGYTPNYNPPKTRKKKSMGLTLIWITFQTMTLTKVAVLWAGSRYSAYDEGEWLWVFAAVLAVVIGNFLFFLWRFRDWKED